MREIVTFRIIYSTENRNALKDRPRASQNFVCQSKTSQNRYPVMETTKCSSISWIGIIQAAMHAFRVLTKVIRAKNRISTRSNRDFQPSGDKMVNFTVYCCISSSLVVNFSNSGLGNLHASICRFQALSRFVLQCRALSARFSTFLVVGFCNLA